MSFTILVIKREAKNRPFSLVEIVKFYVAFFFFVKKSFIDKESE